MYNLVLDRYDFVTGEFGRNISYKIYDESLAAVDLSSYTLYAELLNYELNQECVVTVGTGAVNGQGTFAFTSSINPSVEGLHWIRFRLEKSGTKIWTKKVKVVVVFAQ